MVLSYVNHTVFPVKLYFDNIKQFVKSVKTLTAFSQIRSVEYKKTKPLSFEEPGNFFSEDAGRQSELKPDLSHLKLLSFIRKILLRFNGNPGKPGELLEQSSSSQNGRQHNHGKPLEKAKTADRPEWFSGRWSARSHLRRK